MPGSRISNFAAATAITGDDLFLMVDTGSSTTQRITAANAARDLVKLGISVGTAEPSSPYNGQPWVDLNSNPPVLRVWNGATWTVWSTSPTVVVTSPGISAPSDPPAGVLWLDTSISPNQLRIWNGIAWLQIAPDSVNQTGSTGSAILPSGTTAQRDSVPQAGYLRYNSTLAQFEGYNGSAWGAVGGGATGGTGNAAFYENDINITANYTITTNRNAMSAGPVIVASGVVVTVPAGSTWTVV